MRRAKKARISARPRNLSDVRAAAASRNVIDFNRLIVVGSRRNRSRNPLPAPTNIPMAQKSGSRNRCASGIVVDTTQFPGTVSGMRVPETKLSETQHAYESALHDLVDSTRAERALMRRLRRTKI